MIPSPSVSAPPGRALRPPAASPATLILRAIFAVLFAACSGPAASGGASASPGASSTITVREAWVRPAAAGAESAAYLTITNAGPADRLIAVGCTFATSAMLHQTTTDPSGMTGMAMIENLPIPAGATVKLEPGGTHIMLSGLSQALATGATVELRLVFDLAGTLTVPATVALR
jgi:copper(I)-binding protein